MAIQISTQTYNLSTWRLLRPFRLLRGLINTVIFGARMLEIRRTRMISVKMDTSVDLLHFDMSPKTALAEIVAARRNFRNTLNLRIARRCLYAKLTYEICLVIREHLISLPARMTDDEQDDDEQTGETIKPRIRVRLLKPVARGAHALRVVWQCSSDDAFRADTDDRMLFRRETSLPGLAWKTWGWQYKKVSRDPNAVVWDVYNSEQHRYVHRLIWAETEWMLAIPVSLEDAESHNSTDWVIVIDSNIDESHFLFSQRSKEDLIRSIRKIANALGRIESEAERNAATLDRLMEVPS